MLGYKLTIKENYIYIPQKKENIQEGNQEEEEHKNDEENMGAEVPQNNNNNNNNNQVKEYKKAQEENIGGNLLLFPTTGEYNEYIASTFPIKDAVGIIVEKFDELNN